MSRAKQKRLSVQPDLIAGQKLAEDFALRESIIEQLHTAHTVGALDAKAFVSPVKALQVPAAEQTE